MLESISHITTTYPRRVLAFWGLLLLLSLPFASRVSTVLSNESGWAPDSQARYVRDTVAATFGEQADYDLVLTAEAISRASSADYLSSELDQLARRLEGLAGVAKVDTASSQPLIPNFDASSRQSLALIGLTVTEREAVAAAIEAILAALPQNGNVSYNLTGGAAVERELQLISKRDALRAEIVGLSISLIILLFVFGAVVAATLPLIVAVLTIVFSLASLYLVGQFGQIASFGLTVVSLLGLATGIDYALLMVNRYREELANGLGARAAAKTTVLTAGKAVSVSGLTVLIALSALLIPPLAYIRSMGIASVIVMLFSVSVSITALPALLALLGENVNRLKLTRRTPGTRTRDFWRRRAESVMTRPKTWAILGLGALILVSVPTLVMRVDISGVRGLTASSSAKRAQGVLESLNLSSLQSSIDVLVDFGEQGFFYPSSVRAMASLTRQVETLADIKQVLSPMTVQGVPPLLVYQYYAAPEVAEKSPLSDLTNATVSRDGQYALLQVFPAADASPGVIAALAEQLGSAATDLGLSASLGGLHMADREWARALYGSLPLAIGLVYLATFILLGLAFRSVLIPIKSIILNTLTVAAAFGVVTLVFQFGWFASLFGLEGGLGFVETSIPIFIFAIVFGLSMDYEVFLVSRIYEGHLRGMSDREAVSYALSSTGSIISSAALIMGIVFAAFIFSSVVLIKTLALGLSVAILLDATLVRSALVPAVMTLAGRWNWWLPEPFARLANKVNLGHD